MRARGSASDRLRQAHQGLALVLVLHLVVAPLTGCRAPAGGGPGGTKAVRVDDFRKQLEFTARTRDQEQTSKVGAGDTKSKEREFEEAIRLEADGSIYHPNFLEYSIAGLFGLLQQDFESEFDGRKRSSGDDGDIIEFDLEGRWLKKKPYPGTTYARRYRTLEPRPFLSSLETTTTNYGFAWQYVDAKMPTSLQFNHTDVKLDPLDDREETGEQENTSLRFETSYRFSDTNVLSFQYERRSVSERPFDLDYDSDELTLAHKLDLGGRHRLDSELNYFKQTGTFDIERFRWRETLRLQHTDSLRSWYQTEILDRTQGSLSGVPPIEERSYFASGTLEHEWYDSLVSQLYLYGQRQKFDDGLKIERLGIQPSFDYRKKNRWGQFLANYSYRAQSEDREGTGRDLEIIDERGTFRDPEPITLSNTNVVISSIRVTAEDRVTLYRLSEDYRVRQVGDRVELERIPTGRIADGQVVLIDYVWMLGGDFKLDTTAHNVSLRQNFKFGLSPYYRFREQDQELSPRTATGVQPENLTAHLYGLEFAKGPLRLIGEYEDYDSNINPFDAIRLSGDWTQRFEGGGTGRLRARWTDIDRTDELERRTKFFTIEGRYRQRIGKHFTVEGALLYRTEDDSVSGDDEGVDADLTLEWIIRETEVRLTYEHGRFEDDFAENKTQTLYVQVKRRF